MLNAAYLGVMQNKDNALNEPQVRIMSARWPVASTAATLVLWAYATSSTYDHAWLIQEKLAVLFLGLILAVAMAFAVTRLTKPLLVIDLAGIRHPSKGIVLRNDIEDPSVVIRRIPVPPFLKVVVYSFRSRGELVSFNLSFSRLGAEYLRELLHSCYELSANKHELKSKLLAIGSTPSKNQLAVRRSLQVAGLALVIIVAIAYAAQHWVPR